jgi:hypothetical protein
MALHITRDERGYLRVVEIVISAYETKRTFWYYDTDRWLRTVRGVAGEEPTLPMVGSEIMWVKRYYLPRLQ